MLKLKTHSGCHEYFDSDMSNSANTVYNCLNTVKPVLRGHPWDKEKWPYKTGDLLKEVKFI
jgi:hypothetical protein